MNHTDLIGKIAAARRVGTPVAAVNTPDQPALEKALAGQFGAGEKAAAVYAWDLVRGVHALNELAVADLAQLGGDDLCERTKMNPVAALDEARKFAAGSVLVFHNAQRYAQDAGVCQAIINLRDEFKATQSMVVLIGTGISLAGEVASDVVQWTEPLPDDERLTQIVAEQVAQAASQFVVKPKPEAVRQAATALRGTSAFGAEQLAAMALRKDGIDVETLHTQAKALIEQTPGLTFERGRETFEDIGGLEFAKEFGRRIFAGPKAPAVVVRVEEIEKAMAGARGDLSGTSGDALQVLLSEMEDNDWSGLLAYGCPGAGKSLLAKSLANTHRAKAIRFDINACKASLVGASERNIRQAMQVIRTIGGDRVFLIGSCNRLDNLPPELQRRFRCGVWFFDIPDAKERGRIWQINRAKYKVSADDPTPDEDDLTGADVRNICEQAHVLACPLAEARRYVVPLKTQSPADIEAARKLATGRFTDASRGGVYDRSRQTKATGRKVQVG